MQNDTVGLIRERIGVIVTRGLDSYGYFPLESDKRDYYRWMVDLLLDISGRIENLEIITIIPLRGFLSQVVFDSEIVKNILSKVFENLYDELAREEVKDTLTIDSYKKYESLLIEALSDKDLILVEGGSEYLGKIPEYGDSDSIISLPVTKSRLLNTNRRTEIERIVPSRLTKKFKEVFNGNVKSRSDIIAKASLDINAVTSDSTLNTTLPVVDKTLLTATFAGEGGKIYSSIEKLYESAMEFGGYQGSMTGSVEYQIEYYEYLMTMSYGKKGMAGLGDFEAIFEQRTTDNRVSGLKFLERLFRTRSGNQSVVSGNPVAVKYGNGIPDRYEFPTGFTDYLSLVLESAYVASLKIGDSVRSLINNPPKGIGSTSLQTESLEKIFPSSIDIRSRSTGLTGSLGSFLTSYRSAYVLLGRRPELSGFSSMVSNISEKVSGIVSEMRSTGFKPGGYVPSLALTFYEPDRAKISNNLSRLGFNSSEVQDIMSVTSFQQLLDKFAPMADSQDVISFFRAYDLTKLLYEFGGDTAINGFIDYLYGVDPDKSLLRVLDILNINRSLASKIKSNEFSKLVGYIVTLTYAVDPEQLAVVNSILGDNTLDLFESITQLIQNGISTVLRDKDSISLLSGMVSQMVTVDNSGYESQKPYWNKLIQESAGNIGKGVNGLYDKYDGITPSELYYELNQPSATSPLGKILDGVRGGRLSSLLRYCNLFGLLYTVSTYRNSGQLINNPAEDYTDVLDLIDNMEILSDRLKLVTKILGEDTPVDPDTVYTDNIITAQNKQFSGMINVVKGDETGNVGILESPGVGNSRVPNGIRVVNSLTPEEAAIISEVGQSRGVFTSVSDDSEGGSYIRIAVSNLLANGVNIPISIGNTVSGDIQETASKVTDYRTDYEVPEPTTTSSKKSSFEPVKSCRRFGGNNCNELGYNEQGRCDKGYSKSLYPESGYGSDFLNSNQKVYIDRPLGDKLTSTVTYNSVPDTHPQHTFTANGLSVLSRTNLFKDREVMCASLKDPYQYGACMSLLKCKKFKPPYEGRYSLAFCPSTLHGGRLK